MTLTRGALCNVPGVFVALGWSTILPLPHIMYLHGVWLVWEVARWELLVGLIYTVGAVMYAKRIPERWSPGKYDTSFVRHCHLSPLLPHAIAHSLFFVCVRVCVCVFCSHVTCLLCE
jgi:predicted membrane channel-forming protein YqfA (hemolysin III family)